MNSSKKRIFYLVLLRKITHSITTLHFKPCLMKLYGYFFNLAQVLIYPCTEVKYLAKYISL